MFLDSLTSPLTASSTSVTTTSPHESTTHVSSSSSRSETGVITSSGSNIPDIISLDWRRTHSIVGVIHQNCAFLDLWSVEAIFLVKNYFDIYWNVKWILSPSARWTQMTAARTRWHARIFLVRSVLWAPDTFSHNSIFLRDGFQFHVTGWIPQIKIFVVISSNKIM